MEFIKAELTDDQTGVNVTYSQNLNLSLAFQMLGTLALGIANTALETTTQLIEQDAATNQLTPKEVLAATKGLRDSIYDALNNLFSNVLSQFDPSSPKSDITEEAIIQLENKILEERYNALSPKEQTQYRQHYNKLRLQAQYRRDHAKTNTETNQTETDK